MVGFEWGFLVWVFYSQIKPDDPDGCVEKNWIDGWQTRFEELWCSADVKHRFDRFPTPDCQKLQVCQAAALPMFKANRTAKQSVLKTPDF